MSRALETQIVITAKDQAGQAFKQVAKEASDLSKSLASAAKSQAGFGDAATKGLARTAAELGKAAKTAADLGKSAGKAFEAGPVRGFTKELQNEIAGMKLASGQVRQLSREWVRMQAEQAKALGGISNPRIRAQVMDQDLGNMVARMRSRAREMAELNRLTREISAGGHGAGAVPPKHGRRWRVMDIHPGAIAGVYGAHEARRGLEYFAHQGGELERERARQEASGMTRQERAAAETQSLELFRRYPSVGRVQIMEHLRNLRGTFGDMHHAQEALPDIVKAHAALSLFSGGEGAGQDLDRLVKGLETIGLAANPATFRKMLNAFVKARALFGSTLTGEGFRQFVQTGATSVKGLSERYLATVAPTMMQHTSGPTFGTMQSSAFSALVGGRMTKASKAALSRYGLLDKNGRLVDEQLFASDPDLWAEKHARANLEKKGIRLGDPNSPDRTRAITEITKMFSNRKAGEFITDLLLNRDIIRKDQENFRKAHGIEGADTVAQRDPFTAWKGFTESLASLAQTAASPAMPAAISAINSLTGALNGLAERAKKNSALSEAATIGAAGAATGAGIGLGAGLLRKGWGWIRGRPVQWAPWHAAEAGAGSTLFGGLFGAGALAALGLPIWLGANNPENVAARRRLEERQRGVKRWGDSRPDWMRQGEQPHPGRADTDDATRSLYSPVPMVRQRAPMTRPSLDSESLYPSPQPVGLPALPRPNPLRSDAGGISGPLSVTAASPLAIQQPITVQHAERPVATLEGQAQVSVGVTVTPGSELINVVQQARAASSGHIRASVGTQAPTSTGASPGSSGQAAGSE